MIAEYLRHRFHHEGSATEHFAAVCQLFRGQGWSVRQVDPSGFSLWLIEGRTKDLAFVRRPSLHPSVWELAEITYALYLTRVYLLHSYYDYEDRCAETVDLYGLPQAANLAMRHLGLLYRYDFKA